MAVRPRAFASAALLALAACGPGPDRASHEPDRSRWQTELPANITSELASYLDLEFGAPAYSAPLDPSELRYVGEFVVDGSPTKFWSFPCHFEPGCWAYVAPLDDGYSLSWGGTPPPSSAPVGEKR